MRWEDLPTVVEDWTEKVAATAYDVRGVASRLFTDDDVGYYINPSDDTVAVYSPRSVASDLVRAKIAVDRLACVRPEPLQHAELAAADGTWIKVAYSPTLRRTGELLNFFPGQYPGGIPNAPSPVAAMLTSGLLGAGLGWAGGKLLGKVLPGAYGYNLGRTGALLGGALGAAPGAVWGATNKLTGRGLNDPSLLNHPAGAEPIEYPRAMDGTNAVTAPPDSPDQLQNARRLLDAVHAYGPHRLKLSEWIEHMPLPEEYTREAVKAASTFGVPDLPLPHSADVNINHLGQVLWDTGASPQLAATTMATMFAARQLPDPSAHPGIVTGHQLGQLAMNAAGDYVRGRLAGVAINAAIGTPYRSGVFGAGNAALGVIGSVIPQLLAGS